MSRPLTTEEAQQVATSVFGWFGFFLVAAFGFAYRLVLFGTSSDAERDEPLRARVAVRSQFWLWALGGVLAVIALFSSDDVIRLAATFKPWGVLIAAIYLWPVWFVLRLLSLNADDVADYSLDSDERRAIDKKWQMQSKANQALRIQLVFWIASIAIAILWLLHLVQLPYRALFSFFNS
jgi:hypothetical protein